MNWTEEGKFRHKMSFGNHFEYAQKFDEFYNCKTQGPSQNVTIFLWPISCQILLVNKSLNLDFTVQ